MGKIGLKIKANLTNVNKLFPLDFEQFCWALKVKCTGCGEENPNWHLISLEDKIELINASANFVYKCKCCSRENHLSIIQPNNEKSKSKASHNKKQHIESIYLDSDDDNFKLIVGFDCRGLELIDYNPRGGWAVQSGKKLFDDVDLSSKEWCEYNDMDNVPVEITNFESEFEVLK